MKKILFLILSTAVLASCGNKSEDKKTTLDKLQKEYRTLGDKIKKLQDEIALTDTSKKDKAKLVQLQTLANSRFEHYLEVQGNVEADDNVLVAPKQPGVTITKILVHAGDQVTMGQVLAEGDATAMNAQIDATKVQLDLATTAFERQQNLWNQKIGSELQYLQSKAQKDGLEKTITALKTQMQYTKIVAPFNGVVEEVKIKEGEMAANGFTGIRIVNTSKMKIKANVADMFINKVKRGNSVLIVVPEMDQEIAANVSYSGTVVNTVSRTFNVEVITSNAALKPNMLTTLKINDATLNNVMVISENIIQQSENGPFVMTVERKAGKMIAHKSLVKTGLSYNGKIVITEGLKAGDEIIATGYGDLVEGEEIKL